jgi:hypothetical protein
MHSKLTCVTTPEKGMTTAKMIATSLEARWYWSRNSGPPTANMMLDMNCTPALLAEARKVRVRKPSVILVSRKRAARFVHCFPRLLLHVPQPPKTPARRPTERRKLFQESRQEQLWRPSAHRE